MVQGQSAAAPCFFHSRTQQTHASSTRSMCLNTSLTQGCSWVGKCSTFCCQLPPKGISLQSWASALASRHLHQLCGALGAASPRAVTKGQGRWEGMAGELRAWPEPAALPALLWWRSENVGAQEAPSSGTAVHSQPASPRHGNTKRSWMGWERLCNLSSGVP